MEADGLGEEILPRRVRLPSMMTMKNWNDGDVQSLPSPHYQKNVALKCPRQHS